MARVRPRLPPRAHAFLTKTWRIVVHLLVHLVFLMLLFVAASIDLRERRLPNELAVILVLAAAFSALFDVVPAALARRAGASLAFCAALAAVELFWRRVRGESGMGMGDIKALFAVMLTGPVAGFAAFVIGLIVLAATGAALRRRTLPFLPFLAGGYAFSIGFMHLAAG